MNWLKDYNVKYKGKVYKNCVECRVNTVESWNTRHNGSTNVIEEMEILYIDGDGMLDVLTNSASEFKFVRKPQVIKCED